MFRFGRVFFVRFFALPQQLLTSISVLARRATRSRGAKMAASTARAAFGIIMEEAGLNEYLTIKGISTSRHLERIGIDENHFVQTFVDPYLQGVTIGGTEFKADRDVVVARTCLLSSVLRLGFRSSHSSRRSSCSSGGHGGSCRRSWRRGDWPCVIHGHNVEFEGLARGH